MMFLANGERNFKHPRRIRRSATDLPKGEGPGGVKKNVVGKTSVEPKLGATETIGGKDTSRTREICLERHKG